MRYLPLILIAGSVATVPAGLAQDRTGSMEAKPSNSAWVKLCETPAATNKNFFEKFGAIGTKTCVTYHERMDANTGMVMVAVALRQTGGQRAVMVLMPAGMEQGPGIKLIIFPGGLWEKVQRRERLDKQEEGRLRVVYLRYAFCRAEGCTAEMPASPELIADLKSNAGFAVVAIRGGQAIALNIPLSGFREAYNGPPADAARFEAARNELLRQIRERQKELQKRSYDQNPQQR
jgi:invasion protein IalB